MTLNSGLTVTLRFTLGVTFFVCGSRLADDFCDGTFVVADLSTGLFIAPGIIIVGLRESPSGDRPSFVPMLPYLFRSASTKGFLRMLSGLLFFRNEL